MTDVSLLEMMNAREMRMAAQQFLLRQYKKPLISFTLNIPGPIKVLPGVPDAFEEGCCQIEKTLTKHLVRINHVDTVKQKTGYEAYYSVDASPEFIKKLMISLEDKDRLGRIFDIDVLRKNGVKISREELGYSPRPCLLCTEPALLCGRSRKHNVKELIREIEMILSERK